MQSSFIPSLHFSYFAELFKGELNGDWDKLGAPDIDSADEEHGGEYDTRSWIDKC